ncbi:MAG: hypothetical protein JSU59_06500 [Nitrospirota bacterium]|nr:MAG: hypothetical protein JSU59_06500 [Nitrospirota bacterium]
MSVEAKWKANQDKVSFLKQFPGLLTSWSQTIGHTIQHVKVLKSKPQRVVLIFSNGSFLVVSLPTCEPQELTAGLLEARDLLEAQHPEAFAEYDRLDQIDNHAGRVARMENILGAIHNNLEQIPELKDRLRQLVHEWESKR